MRTTTCIYVLERGMHAARASIYLIASPHTTNTPPSAVPHRKHNQVCMCADDVHRSTVPRNSGAWKFTLQTSPRAVVVDARQLTDHSHSEGRAPEGSVSWRLSTVVCWRPRFVQAADDIHRRRIGCSNLEQCFCECHVKL